MIYIHKYKSFHKYKYILNININQQYKSELYKIRNEVIEERGKKRSQ